jgi:hypothetical protein
MTTTTPPTGPATICPSTAERRDTRQTKGKRTMTEIILETDTAEDVCYPGSECPDCGENRIDWLIWLDDETVECQSCGMMYAEFPRDAA